MIKFKIDGPSTVVLEYKTINERVPTIVFIKEEDKIGFEAYLKSLRTVKYTITEPKKEEGVVVSKKKKK